MAMARSCAGGVALSYVLPVLWMTSRLAVMGAMPKRGGCTVQRTGTALSGVAIPGRSLMSVNACSILQFIHRALSVSVILDQFFLSYCNRRHTISNFLHVVGVMSVSLLINDGRTDFITDLP